MKRKVFFYLMVVIYLAAGINHFLYSQYYLSVIPKWIPYKIEMVYLSGLIEILFSLLLIPKRTRCLAAWGIILLLIAVFPANIQMAINFSNQNHPLLWIAILRLPIQFLLIWWAYIYTKSQIF